MNGIQRLETRRDPATGVLHAVAVMADGRRRWPYHNPALNPVEDDCICTSASAPCMNPDHYRLRPYRYDRRYGWVES